MLGGVAFCFWKDDTADSEWEGSAFRAISLLSTSAIMSLMGNSSTPEAPNTSLFMSVSKRPLSITSRIT